MLSEKSSSISDRRTEVNADHAKWVYLGLPLWTDIQGVPQLTDRFKGVKKWTTIWEGTLQASPPPAQNTLPFSTLFPDDAPEGAVYRLSWNFAGDRKQVTFISRGGSVSVEVGDVISYPYDPPTFTQFRLMGFHLRAQRGGDAYIIGSPIRGTSGGTTLQELSNLSQNTVLYKIEKENDI